MAENLEMRRNEVAGRIAMLTGEKKILFSAISHENAIALEVQCFGVYSC